MNKKAFTLVEMMVAICIFLIILAAAYLVLSTGKNTWWTSSTYTELNQEIRKAKEWISKELQQARRVGLIIAAGNNSITFNIPVVNIGAGATAWRTIQYSIGGLNNSQLLRNDGGAIKVLANNINPALTTFVQDLDTPRRISVSITANKQDKRGRPITSTLVFDICLRN